MIIFCAPLGTVPGTHFENHCQLNTRPDDEAILYRVVGWVLRECADRLGGSVHAIIKRSLDEEEMLVNRKQLIQILSTKAVKKIH